MKKGQQLGMYIAWAMILSFSLPCYAQGSGYYEIPESGRPRSVFSICCCEKENETENQVLYSCNYVESEVCPFDTQQYKVAVNDCPDSLMYTKYEK